MVPEEGLEPSSLAACDFESHAYTNSATPAFYLLYTKDFKNSLPTPDFKYFSRLRASSPVPHISLYTSLRGA